MNFETALNHMLNFEGGYANDPDDRGGETFRGISRLNWPDWAGWVLIDEAKAEGHRSARDLNANFEDDEYLAQQVTDFYFLHFWNPFQSLGASIRITAKLFDTGVNMGVGRAVKFLQKIVGTSVDGAIGPKTRQAFSDWVRYKENDEQTFLSSFCEVQADFYRGIVQRNPRQGKFLRGWLRRAAWLPE